MPKVSADAELRELGTMLRGTATRVCECGFFSTRRVQLDQVAMEALGNPYFSTDACDACDACAAAIGYLKIQFDAKVRSERGLLPVEDVVRGHVVSTELPTARLARRHRALLVGE